MNEENHVNELAAKDVVKENPKMYTAKDARENLSVVIEYSELTIEECDFIQSVVAGYVYLKNKQKNTLFSLSN